MSSAWALVLSALNDSCKYSLQPWCYTHVNANSRYMSKKTEITLFLFLSSFFSFLPSFFLSSIVLSHNKYLLNVDYVRDTVLRTGKQWLTKYTVSSVMEPQVQGGIETICKQGIIKKFIKYNFVKYYEGKAYGTLCVCMCVCVNTYHEIYPFNAF